MMIPRAFQYLRPTTLADAAGLLAECGDESKLIAGGHSLLPMMKLRLAAPAVLIDIGRLSELHGIREQDGTIIIGASTTHYTAETSEILRRHCPLLAEAASAIGDVQVRNRGTIGGSIAHADPAADWPPAVLAVGAQIKLVHASGERIVSVSDFFVDFLTTAMEANEVLTEIHLPVNPPRTGSVYLKVPQPASGFALTGVAAQVTLGSDRKIERVAIGITGVGSTPYRATAVEQAILGRYGSSEAVTEAAGYAADGVELLDDIHASGEYRQHLARVYTKRALQAALQKVQV